MKGSRKDTEDEKVIPVRDVEAEEDAGLGDDSEPTETTTESEASVDETSATAAPEEDELTQLRNKVAELEDQRLRALAEFDNYKKRTARQYDDMVQAAHERVMGDLLEVVDNFERALKHDDERAGERTEEGKAFRQGTEMIYNQLLALLAKYDVTPIESLGHEFDPALHEALMQVSSDEYEEGTVAMEVARGYKIGDRVLRHAKVGVSSGAVEQNDDNE